MMDVLFLVRETTTRMTRPRLFYTDQHVIPLPDGHKFPIRKYRLLREMLEADQVFEFQPAPLAERATIELVHSPEYVSAFVEGRLDAAAIRKIGFPWSSELVKRTLASVGGTLAATEEALSTRWGGTLAGGTHHAFTAEGSGFCVFNDIAVAIRRLQGTGKIERAAVVDLDVHQGDGTAHIFGDDASVLTLSIHCKDNFPLRKQAGTIDVELNAGVRDEEYMRVLAEVLPKVWDFEPEIIFYQSGVDGLKSDVLGKLELTLEGLKARDREVMRGVNMLNVPLIITLGGGYSNPIELTAEAHANTFRMAREILGKTLSRAPSDMGPSPA
jgi:acetoin utilization deacetylase AcuC-like enzyme